MVGLDDPGAFFTLDDSKPNALFFFPDGSSLVTFCSVFLTRGRGRREVCCGRGRQRSGCFELAVARFRAELKIDTAR